MSKRRFVVPAFFVVDLDENDFSPTLDKNVREIMLHCADDLAIEAQGDVNRMWSGNELSNGNELSLLLDEVLPTMEVKAEDDFPHSVWRIALNKLAEEL